jgi:hypothetical protein
MLPDCPAAALLNVISVLPVVVQVKSLPTAKSKLPSFSAVTVTPTDLPVTSTSLLTVTLVDAVKSIVGAVISHSVSASISNCPSVLELTDKALSLKSFL